jgi:site-specific DNA-methyltransferase (adenine-specific)
MYNGQSQVESQVKLPVNQILQGDCVAILDTLPPESVDCVFADPPYNLQLNQELWRPNQTRVNAVNDEWDHFTDFSAYDQFTRQWLEACRRVLKPTGTLWVIGTYHNIHRVGTVLQDLEFWILNSIVWIKENPMPNFHGVRFTNAHETLIWAQKKRGAPYTFNYQAMKALNDGLQMRSDWRLPICNGSERLRQNGEKAHSTQKPESLLYYILQASSSPGDIVLDPFFGTGTTGVVARRLHRQWIGIEREPRYVALATTRIDQTPSLPYDPHYFDTPDRRKQPRLPFGQLLANDLLHPGDWLYYRGDRAIAAQVMSDGALEYHGRRGSIHQIARQICQAPCNGWEAWFYLDNTAELLFPIDRLRQALRAQAPDFLEK